MSGLISGALVFSETPPSQVRSRVKKAQKAIQFFSKLRIADGLKSTGKKRRFNALLGKLGTASVRLGADAPIKDVLSRAKVALKDSVDIDQLAEWHRLGHLRGVAAGLAEALSKPCTMRTVKDRAKEPLLEEKREAEEQAEKEKREAKKNSEARKSRRKVLNMLDAAIGVVHKNLLEATAAKLPERGKKSLKKFVVAQMQQPGGLSAAVRMAASSPAELSVVSQAVEQPWWLLWPGTGARTTLANTVAWDIEALTKPINPGNDRNLGLLFNLVGVETLPLNLASACGSAFCGRAAPRRSSIVLRPPRSERTRCSSPPGLPGS